MTINEPAKKPAPDFIDMPADQVTALMTPYIRADWTHDSEWNRRTAPVRQRILKQAVKRFLTGWFSKNFSRTESQVVERYSDKWIARNAALVPPVGAEMPLVWRNRKLLVDSIGVRKLYVARLMRLIEETKPESVLDIGCGNGEKLFMLAARFPKVKFYGIDITPGGIAAAKMVQQHDALPAWLAEYSPEPLVDLSAHKRIDFRQASAKDLPFSHLSIDLVYTSLALEQMQAIKNEVFAEIARVCRRHASFFEAFRDFNKSGLPRIYNYAENYFRGEMRELEKLGFAKVRAFVDLPQKIWMNNVHVLASKA